MRVAIIADDLTGAADTGVQLARAGYRTAVAFRDAPIPPAEDLDAVALDTDSRAMPAGFAAKRVMEAGHTVRHARIVYKKLDSTLRGPIAAELAAALGASGRDRAVVAPAFPAAGRTTVDGVQLVRGVPVHETEAKNDPRTPVREGHVPTLLATAFPSVVSLSVEDLANPAAVRRARRCAWPRVPRPARRISAPTACAGPQGAGRGGQSEQGGPAATAFSGEARVRGGACVRSVRRGQGGVGEGAGGAVGGSVRGPALRGGQDLIGRRGRGGGAGGGRGRSFRGGALRRAGAHRRGHGGRGGAAAGRGGSTAGGGGGAGHPGGGSYRAEPVPGRHQSGSLRRTGYTGKGSRDALGRVEANGRAAHSRHDGGSGGDRARDRREDVRRSGVRE